MAALQADPLPLGYRAKTTLKTGAFWYPIDVGVSRKRLIPPCPTASPDAMRWPTILLITLTFAACQTTGALQVENPHASASWNAQQICQDTKNAYEALQTAAPQQRDALLRTAKNQAETCVMSLPEEAACYYYRASIQTTSPADSKEVEKNFQKTIALDPSFDHGGAYRRLGLWVAKDPHRQKEAENFLSKAIQTDGSYPENHLAYVDFLLASGREKEASESLVTAAGLVDESESSPLFVAWQKKVHSLNTTMDKQQKE